MSRRNETIQSDIRNSEQDMLELSPYNPRSDESLKDEISKFEKQIDVTFKH